MISLKKSTRMRFAPIVAIGTLVGAAYGHVQLLAPNGGELLEVGCTYTITWRIQIAHNTLNWDLWYSTESSSGPWTVIAMDLPPGDTSQGSIHEYDWTVPDDLSGTVYVRVRMDNTSTDYEDVSDGPNSIEPIAGDVNRDGAVDQADLGLLLAAWNSCEGDAAYEPNADFDGDGCIGQPDLGILLANWGAGCS